MQKLRRGAHHALLALTLAPIAGCTGKIGNEETLPPITTNPTPLCRGLDPGPTYIRRLNRTEYNNTVRDLLGTSLRPANTFPTEEKRLGFDDNSAALSVSPVLTEQYMMAAEALAADAVDNHWADLVPCAATTTGAAADTCARDFIGSFGRKARRKAAFFSRASWT